MPVNGNHKLHATGTKTIESPARVQLWKLLTKKSLLPFRQNQRIGAFDVDFCCFREKIVIEISEFPFEDPKRIDETMERHLGLIDMGYSVLSFSPETVMKNSTYILEMIRSHVQCNHSDESRDLDFF